MRMTKGKQVDIHIHIVNPCTRCKLSEIGWRICQTDPMQQYVHGMVQFKVCRNMNSIGWRVYAKLCTAVCTWNGVNSKCWRLYVKPRGAVCTYMHPASGFTLNNELSFAGIAFGKENQFTTF